LKGVVGRSPTFQLECVIFNHCVITKQRIQLFCIHICMRQIIPKVLSVSIIHFFYNILFDFRWQLDGTLTHIIKPYVNHVQKLYGFTSDHVNDLKPTWQHDVRSVHILNNHMYVLFVIRGYWFWVGFCLEHALTYTRSYTCIQT
jgi:hypothetical protein